ncbi:MAG: hypothetical protein Q8N05_18310 [Bacteroidota bacterium]|nr:hypothetical protein [Bacteroidota bacterium]
MKTNDYIFRYLFFTLFLILIAIAANSQGTIQTPMGQTVMVDPGGDDSYWVPICEADAAQWIIDNNSDAQRIGAATTNYNCHSYAWNVSEGGSSINAWLKQTYNGQPNLSKYWTNDAYTSTSNVGDYEKI